MGSLEGKVALVTGASRGIGRAIALELARDGARVALNYRSGHNEARAVAEEIGELKRSFNRDTNEHGTARDAAILVAAAVGGTGTSFAPGANGGSNETSRAMDTSAAQDDNVLLVQADVSDSGQARSLVDTVVARWGRLDILVNNAGITRDRTLRKLGDDDWLAVINTNLNSVFYCTSAAVPVMIKQGFGRVINISSLIAQSGNIGQANYAAAKGGIISFTKTAALELARNNITVNAIAPGFTETDMFANVPLEIQEQLKAKIPLGRFGRPDEVAKAVLFLAAHGDYITGQQININGGMYL